MWHQEADNTRTHRAAMYSQAHHQWCIRKLWNFVGDDRGEESQRHIGHFSSVFIPVSHWHAASHNVAIADRLHLQRCYAY